MGDELRFAVCTFRRVFDAAPSQEVLNLEQLTAGLLRFALRPELQAKVEREHKKIAAAVKMWEQQSGSGRRKTALVRMSREAERDNGTSSESVS